MSSDKITKEPVKYAIIKLKENNFRRINDKEIDKYPINKIIILDEHLYTN